MVFAIFCSFVASEFGGFILFDFSGFVFFNLGSFIGVELAGLIGVKVVRFLAGEGFNDFLFNAVGIGFADHALGFKFIPLF